MKLPGHCVVDTGVAMVGNGAHTHAPPDCVAECARALQHVGNQGHVYVDEGGAIVAEYRRHLSAGGQPGPGDAFFKWLLTHEWGGKRVTRVTVTPKPADPTDYLELPAPPAGTVYDPSDRKFLAVAAAHPSHPPILQALDSKWWGWRAALKAIGVSIHFLCPAGIAAKHEEKIGS